MKKLVVYTMIAGIWILLFPNLAAAKDHKLNFSFKKFQKERDEVYGLNKNEFEEYLSIRKSMNLPVNLTGYPIDIGIDKYDLNGDGVDEIFVYISEDGYCGSNGCSFIVYKRTGNGLYAILKIVSYDDIKILNSINNGYHDLSFKLQWAIGGVEYSVWRWNGKTYYCYLCPKL